MLQCTLVFSSINSFLIMWLIGFLLFVLSKSCVRNFNPMKAIGAFGKLLVPKAPLLEMSLWGVLSLCLWVLTPEDTMKRPIPASSIVMDCPASTTIEE